MGVEDKFNNSAENTTGKVKEGVGRVTDNEQLEAEGRADQSRASIKQAGEKIKDAFRS
ncbi:CsbD family protein [Verrucosispora sp. ts21]|uniref:CsbD family protein n=1 Tax=Verrucosispora sp. ts21 TaxID=2069341 RepID=UPI000C88CC7B|nr:CsbD family protein [Verrucosispora sp. ts21]PMR61986.1 CsbD family protein [Verrucosispora sp. ts21]